MNPGLVGLAARLAPAGIEFVSHDALDQVGRRIHLVADRGERRPDPPPRGITSRVPSPTRGVAIPSPMPARLWSQIPRAWIFRAARWQFSQ
jgi:hypothetical protein